MAAWQQMWPSEGTDFKLDSAIDPSQKPAPFITVATSDMPCCSYAVKNTSKEEE